ncbi:MAG: DUF4010 domain-containing protein [Candidatus Thorarchaeota archaeon]
MVILQSLFLSPDLVIRSLVGFAVGALIGLERQKRMTEGEVIGVRSFGLHSLLGAVSAYTYTLSDYQNIVVLLYASVISAAIVVVQLVHKVFFTPKKGTTTSIVFAFSFVLGVLVGLDAPPSSPDSFPIGGLQMLAMAMSVLTFLVLGFKEEVAHAVAGISKEEMISAAELLVLILFFWPLMPESVRFLGLEFPAFLMYELIVLLLGVSFLNYVLVKKYRERGPLFFGIFGGLANSEAAVSSISEYYVETGRSDTETMSVACLLTNISMVGRNGLIIALLDPSLQVLRYYLVPMAIMCTVGLVRVLQERTGTHSVDQEELHSRLSSPFEFHAAIKFAALFIAISTFSLLMQDLFQDAGVIIAAIVGGLASAGAVVASMTLLYVAQGGTITVYAAVYAATVATVMSVMNKTIYVYIQDREGALAKNVLRDSLIMVAGVLAYLVLAPLVQP